MPLSEKMEVLNALYNQLQQLIYYDLQKLQNNEQTMLASFRTIKISAHSLDYLSIETTTFKSVRDSEFHTQIQSSIHMRIIC